MAIGAIISGALKAVGKQVAKAAIKEIAEVGAKKAVANISKKVAEEGVKNVARNIAKKSVKVATKGLQKTAEEIAKSPAEYAKRQAVNMAKSQAKRAVRQAIQPATKDAKQTAKPVTSTIAKARRAKRAYDSYKKTQERATERRRIQQEREDKRAKTEQARAQKQIAKHEQILAKAESRDVAQAETEYEKMMKQMENVKIPDSAYSIGEDAKKAVTKAADKFAQDEHRYEENQEIIRKKQIESFAEEYHKRLANVGRTLDDIKPEIAPVNLRPEFVTIEKYYYNTGNIGLQNGVKKGIPIQIPTEGKTQEEAIVDWIYKRLTEFNKDPKNYKRYNASQLNASVYEFQYYLNKEVPGAVDLGDFTPATMKFDYDKMMEAAKMIGEKRELLMKDYETYDQLIRDKKFDEVANFVFSNNQEYNYVQLDSFLMLAGNRYLSREAEDALNFDAARRATEKRLKEMGENGQTVKLGDVSTAITQNVPFFMHTTSASAFWHYFLNVEGLPSEQVQSELVKADDMIRSVPISQDMYDQLMRIFSYNVEEIGGYDLQKAEEDVEDFLEKLDREIEKYDI